MHSTGIFTKQISPEWLKILVIWLTGSNNCFPRTIERAGSDGYGQTRRHDSFWYITFRENTKKSHLMDLIPMTSEDNAQLLVFFDFCLRAVHVNGTSILNSNMKMNIAITPKYRYFKVAKIL